MIATYIGLRRSRHGQRDLTAIFQGTMFQLTRRLQIFLQKSRAISTKDGWRPSIVAVTRFGERRLGHFDLLRWICHRHGFGQFIQFSEGRIFILKRSCGAPRRRRVDSTDRNKPSRHLRRFADLPVVSARDLLKRCRCRVSPVCRTTVFYSSSIKTILKK